MLRSVPRLTQDLQLARRGFQRTPGFFVTAVAILGLGIGMSVAMFTVFRTVLLRRLPVVDQDRAVVMWTYRDKPNADYVGGTKEMTDLRRSSRTMTEIAAVAHWPATETPFQYGDRSVGLLRGMVTGNYFDVLGVRPYLGRLMRPSDDEPPGAKPLEFTQTRALVLSYAAWQEKFGGDSGAIGRHLVEPLLKTDYIIIGVTPPGFDYPAHADYWIPMWGGWQGQVSSFVVARLTPHATVAQARDEYLAAMRRGHPDWGFRGAHAATFAETILGNVRPALTLLTCAVALLLLIACLNVGNLLLLRASGRAQELAIRRALGADFGDILRQLTVEAIALAFVGSLLGLVVADGALRLLVAFAPTNLPRLDELQLGGSPFGLAVAIGGLAVLLFGLGPAVVAARANLASPLRLGTRTGQETKRRRALRQTLVAAQVALAMVTLGGAGLLARSLARLEYQDTGFARDHVSTFWVSWNAQKDDTWTKLMPVGDRIVHRVGAIPGITAAAQMIAPPMLGNGVLISQVLAEKGVASDSTRAPTFPFEICSADFFKVFGIDVIEGRAFTDADRKGAPLVAIVSQSIARQLWPDESAVGQRIRGPGSNGEANGFDGWRTVVGVVRDTRLRTLRERSPTVYVPSAQGWWQGSVAIRSTVPLANLLPTLRAAVHDVDPDLGFWQARTMDQVLDPSLSQSRLEAVLMSSFGVVALLLAAIGLFGVMASLVRDQTREFGIRIALGATPERIRRDVLRRAALVTGIGAVIGVGVALATSRLFTALLFDVSPTDPLSLGGACLVLLAVGAGAAYLPARRATRIDPAQALRVD